MNSILAEYGLPVIALVVSIVVLTLQIKKQRHMKKMMKKDEDYAGFLLYLEKQKELLKLVKKKGVLVKRMKVRDDFLIDRPPNELYKKNLGAVEVWDLFKRKIKSVYVVYEDFDGTIKYYDYPQS